MKRRSQQKFLELYGRIPSESEFRQFCRNYTNDLFLSITDKERKDYQSKHPKIKILTNGQIRH